MAIINMTEGGASGIKVGYDKSTVVKELKIRDYTFMGIDPTPLDVSSGYNDWYMFVRNGQIYMVLHHTFSANKGIWRYDPVTEIYTQETDMTLPPVGTNTVGSTPYLYMHSKRYLYDQSTDTVYFSTDYSTGYFYKFDFTTLTWTALTFPSALPTLNKGYDWVINSNGIIAVCYPYGKTYAPYIFENDVWTALEKSPTANVSRYIYNVNDELCFINGVTGNSSGLYKYSFNDSVWEQQYQNAYQMTDDMARLVTIDNEGNIILLGYLIDFKNANPPTLSYSTHSIIADFTEDGSDRLHYMQFSGIGATEDTPTNRTAFITFYRGAVVWIGNTGYLLYDYSVSSITPTGTLKLVKMKPMYTLVEN